MESLWHTKSPEALFKEFETRSTGLSDAEAKERIARYGANMLPEPKVPGIIQVFFSQFLSPLIYVLLGSAVVLLLMGGVTDAIIIGLVLFSNAIFGTIQEGKAQHTLLALRNFVKTSAAVMRNGSIVVLPDKELVPGDIVILQEGDKVPADVRLTETQSLKLNESSLTGESAPVLKTAEAMKEGASAVHDRVNMAFKGTSAVSGSGVALVVATGTATEIGKISETIATIDTDVPLKKNIEFLSRMIIFAVAAIGTLIMIVGLAVGNSLPQMFATVVSLAVSVIPEGLPIVMTLVLATGVLRMTKRHVLVKKLQAVEALGQAQVIAVDKTGTLTKNEVLLTNVYIDGMFFEVDGLGYEPKGDIFQGGATIDPLDYPQLVLAGRIAAFSSNGHAMYMGEKGVWKISGDPTEAALQVFSRKIGFQDGERAPKKIFEIPFDYLTKYHAVIHSFEKKNFLSLVGAPEKILELSDRVWRAKKSEKLSARERKELEKVFVAMSEKGMRVVAFAMNANGPSAVSSGDLPSLTFCGFFGMKDPLRAEVKPALLQAAQAGIRVVMITGDHKITAHAIAEEAGLIHDKESIITGEELERLSDDELLHKFATCNVFARVTPQHKLRIIELFRKRGEVVAMTGDGVNDAPSLAAADLGVAMGKVGTEVAKEASDLVLLDDNFGSIIAAVEEGRSIYRTIKKVILYLFSTGLGEVLTISGALFLGLPLPILPGQIIWLNFVTDGFLVIALAMEPKEEGLLLRGSTKVHKYILGPFTVKRMVFMGVIIAAGTLLVFSYALKGGIEKALTLSLTTLAIFQWFNAWNVKSEDKSVFVLNPFRNMFLIGATITVLILQLLAVYHPFLQRHLHTVPLSLEEWMIAASVAASVLVLEELRKLIQRRMGIRVTPSP